MASSDKHFQTDRAAPTGSTILPAAWHPSLEKHWHAVDEGGAELMRAASGAPARPAPLRIAGPPDMSDAILAERHQPVPRAIDQDPEARFKTSVVMALLVLAVLLAGALVPRHAEPAGHGRSPFAERTTS